MSSTKFFFAVALITVLLILPLLVLLLVRVLVRADRPGAEPAEPELSAEPMTLRDFWEGTVPHLRELRDRLIKSSIGVAIGTAVGFWLVNSPVVFGKTLPNFMVTELLPGKNLQAIGIGEVFVTYMRIALIVGIAIAMPVVVYQLLAFFAPGLLPHEKRIVFSALPFVTGLFLAGLVFGWFFTIPAAVQMLVDFGQTEHIQTLPTVENFTSMVSMLLLWNGLIFELPAVIYLLSWIGIINAGMLARTRRYAIVAIVIFAAVITPTGDPFNLMILAVPMYVLYELGILLARLVPGRRNGQSADRGTSVV